MHKKLSLSVLTSLVVGNMIGSGIFLLPSSLAQYGSITILSFIATAVGAMLLACVFSKLSTLFPKTGGPYVYCKEGFGDFIGFQVAYNYWIYMWAGNAAVAVALSGYLKFFIPSIAHSSFYLFLTSTTTIWFLTLINIKGVHLAGRFQLMLTILKVLPLLLIASIGVFFIDVSNLLQFNISTESNLSAFSGGAMLTLWAFLGLESASIPADNVLNPKRDIPLATIFGTLLTAIVYILATISIMGVVPMTELQQSTAPFALLAEKIMGPVGMYIIGLCAIISCVGALNGWILLQGHIPYAAAKDKMFPSAFGKLSKNGVPVFGTVISTILINILLFLNYNKSLVEQFTLIISLATLSALIAYIYTSASEFTIYLKHPDKVNREHVRKTLAVSSLAFIYSFWALFGAGPQTVFYGTLLMFSSVPLFGWMQWKKSRKIFNEKY